MRRLVISGLIIGLTLNATIALAQGNCSDVLHNVYDKTVRSESVRYSHSFYSYFCDSTFNSYKAAHDAGASIGIDLDFLPLNIGGHDRGSNWSEYQRTICQIIKSQADLSSDVAVAIEKINGDVVKAWQACVTNNASGLYFWAETDDKAGASGTVTFFAKWVGSGGDARVTINPTLQITPSNALDCGTQRFRTALDIAPQSITCTRRIDQAAHVRFQTMSKGDRDARVPEQFKEPPPRPVETITACVSAGGFYPLAGVVAGETILIRSAIRGDCSPTGWSCDRWATASGPDGVVNYRVASALDPNSNIGTLIGAVSTQAGANSPDAVFQAIKTAGAVRIGGALDLRAQRAGTLYLIFNDIPGSYIDNAGAVWIEIRRQRAFDPLASSVTKQLKPQKQ